MAPSILRATVAGLATTAGWWSQILLASALPMQMTINQRATECIYDTLEKDEYVTMSIFITSGAELRATAVLEGPVAPADAASGKDLQFHINNYQMGRRPGNAKPIMIEELVDFEHLNTDLPEDDDDDDESGDEDDEMDERAIARRRRQKEQEARMKMKEKERMAKMKEPLRPRTDGEPFQKTVKAKSPGWYRVCVRGSWYQITAEVEMRKSSELGEKLDEDGHVTTYEDRAMLDEEAEMEKSEEGIKDEDFETTKEQLRKLRRILSEIQAKQQDERHRLVVHAATNEHSHSRMVLSSLLETILFMAITGFQVYTIRKWFQGAPILGR